MDLMELMLKEAESEQPEDGLTIDEIQTLMHQNKGPQKFNRLHHCGQPFFLDGDPATGRGYWCTYECGLSRECPKCRTRKAQEEKAKLTIAASGKPVTVYRAPDTASATSLTRKLNKNRVPHRKYPHCDGTTSFYQVGHDPAIKGDVVKLADLDDAHWETLVDTPKGKNVSGKLARASGAPAAKKSDVARKKVMVSKAKIHDPHDRGEEQMKQDTVTAWEEAVGATYHLDPDIETVDLCLQERRDRFRERLEDYGYRVTFSVYTAKWVSDDDINWQPYSTAIRKKLQKKGLYAEGDEARKPRKPLKEVVGAPF